MARNCCSIKSRKERERFDAPYVYMGVYIVMDKNDCFVDEIASVEDGFRSLLDAVIIQAYKDYKKGDQSAKDFLESYEIGRKILKEEERIYGKRE